MIQAKRALAWATLFWIGGYGLSGCSRVTHAGDFAVLPNAKAPLLCETCPERPDLRHPPCPAATQDDGPQGVYMFALRSVVTGAEPSTWSADYLVGIDQDCSDRPEGTPASCIPPAPHAKWGKLSNGVDNALATQVFYPVQQLTRINPSDRITKSLERGLGVQVLIVDAWNGQPNDPQVGVRVLTAAALANTDGRQAPSWQGDDEWTVYSDAWDSDFPPQTVPDASTKGRNAYVRDGMLVWDARSIKDVRVIFVATAGGVFEMPLVEMSFLGRLSVDSSPSQLVNGVMSGLLSSHYATRSARGVTQMGLECDPCATVQATPVVEKLFAEAADMLLPSSRGQIYCDAISVGLLGNYVEIKRIAGLVPSGSLPESCADAGPCKTQ